MPNAWKGFSGIEESFDPLTRTKRKSWVLLLPTTNPCSWHVATGGCSMCGFNGKWSEKNRYQWMPKLFGARFFDAIYWLGKWLVAGEKPNVLAIYNGGSFFNDGGSNRFGEEIPASFQLNTCHRVAVSPIEELFVESRPEFVGDAKIANLTNELAGKKLRVAIGLESADERVRNRLIKKGMSRECFENAIKTLKKHQAISMAYVFLKPLGLREEEAIEDALKTIRYCFDVGVDLVSLSCGFVQKGTQTEKAFLEGLYQPPSLWSVAKVVALGSKLGPLRINTFEDDPPPIAKPMGCPECNQEIQSALQEYRLTGSLEKIQKLTCKCQR